MTGGLPGTHWLGQLRKGEADTLVVAEKRPCMLIPRAGPWPLGASSSCRSDCHCRSAGAVQLPAPTCTFCHLSARAKQRTCHHLLFQPLFQVTLLHLLYLLGSWVVAPTLSGK